MEQPNVIDKRHERLDDVPKPDYIPFLGGRPLRETVIDRDDLLNLTIQLNISDTVEEFLAALEI